MINLGEVQELTIDYVKPFGAYLSAEGEDGKILLPAKEIPEGAGPGDSVDVFIYRDSQDRLIATTKTPYITMGRIEKLKLKEIANVGGFMDWGLVKDLLLPYKEMSGKPVAGREYVVALYKDKSDRLCATMKIYKKLGTEHEYSVGDHVEGIVYQINDKYGAFVALEDKYHGMIPRNKMADVRLGDRKTFIVTNIREDGKVELSVNERKEIQMDLDCEKLMEAARANDGVMPVNEKSDPEEILRALGMSKAAFKRAVGRLLKQGLIEIGDVIKIK